LSHLSFFTCLSHLSYWSYLSYLPYLSSMSHLYHLICSQVVVTLANKIKILALWLSKIIPLYKIKVIIRQKMNPPLSSKKFLIKDK
jgi:hypothetical protein